MPPKRLAWGPAVVVAVALAVTCANGQEPSFKPRPSRVIPGEVIVKYKAAGLDKVFPRAEASRLSEKFGMRTLATARSLGFQKLQLRPGQTFEGASEGLGTDPIVEYVSRNYVVYPHDVVPNDPGWKELWGLERIGMPRAWDKSKGRRTVVVAVVDTGVDYQHPDLQANMWRNQQGQVGAAFCTDRSDPSNTRTLPPGPDPMDRYGHGTHVAGTIAAVGNNGTDVVGVAWELQIMAVKFLCNVDGSGEIFDAIRAIEFAVTNGAHILNNSWGGSIGERALEDAIRETGRRGVLVVASAGNDSQNLAQSPNYPASFRIANVIAVAATRPDDTLASFSNWSPTLVHIAAPGVDILSLVPRSGVRRDNGTSMAAPHVSGCAALLKALEPARAASQLKMLLLDRADRIKTLQGKVENERRLNCAAAVGP